MNPIEMPPPHQYYTCVIFFIYASFILYAMSAFLYAICAFFGRELSAAPVKETLFKIANRFIILGIITNLLAFAFRWYAGGKVPLNNIFETLCFFSLVTAGIYLFVERRYKLPEVGLYVMSLVLVALGVVAFSPWYSDYRQYIFDNPPALNSYWLPIHVIITFIAYAGFAVAAAAAVRYFITSALHAGRNAEETQAKLDALDSAMYFLIGISYIFLSAGIISGSIWANEAWGQYWMWDPKEVWSLITWLCYTIYLHARMTRGLGKNTYAGLALLGFGFVLFTYICVSYLRVFSGEHSFSS